MRENLPDNQWQKGTSGNLNGRPKGTKNVKTRLKELLAIGDRETAIFEKLIVKAKKGDLRAIEMVLDRIDGKPSQISEVNQTINQQLNIFQALPKETQTQIDDVIDKHLGIE